MATTTGATPKKRATAGKTKRAAPRAKDAVALLKADHRAVEKLFAQFEKARGDERKARLVAQICAELRVHMEIEEEIFYPVSRDYLDDEDIVDEAVVEHASARDLIEQLESMQPGDDLYDAKVTVLSELIEHHVEEEEEDYFPKVKKTDMDLKAVGERLAARKAELMDEMDGKADAAVH